MKTTLLSKTAKNTLAEGLAHALLTLAINAANNTSTKRLDLIIWLQTSGQVRSVRGVRGNGNDPDEDISKEECGKDSESLVFGLECYGAYLLPDRIPSRIPVQVSAEIRLFRLRKQDPWKLHYLTYMHPNLSPSTATVFVTEEFANSAQLTRILEPQRFRGYHSSDAVHASPESVTLLKGLARLLDARL